MKKLQFIIILISFILLGTRVSAQQFFYQDSSMDDLSQEKETVSRIISMVNELKKNGIRLADSNGKQRGMPVSEEQFVRLLKCMNVAVREKGKLLIVAVNKDNNKIVRTYFLEKGKENSNEQLVSIGDYIHLLKTGKLDFKLLKADGKVKKSTNKSRFQSEEYLTNRKNYAHIEDNVDGNYPVLFDELKIYTNVVWEKNFDRHTKEYTYSKIISVSSMCSTNFLGDYVQTNCLGYTEKNELIGETNGKFTMFLNLNENTIKIYFYIKFKTIIDIESGEGKVYAEAYKIEI